MEDLSYQLNMGYKYVKQAHTFGLMKTVNDNEPEVMKKAIS